MDTQKLFPERIISGFFHLSWLVLLAFIILKIPPEYVLDFIRVVSAGSAAIILSIIVGASFFLGNLSDRIITDCIAVYCKRKKIVQMPISEVIQLRAVNPEKIIDLKSSYGDKAFFRSIFFAGILLIVLSLLWNYNYGANINVFVFIIVFGLILECSSLRIVFVLRKHYKEVYRDLRT
jgi:hypothetical protein